MTPESLAVAVIVLAFALRAVHQLFPAVSRNAMTRLRFCSADGVIDFAIKDSGTDRKSVV